jgi:hypothetical protein
MALTPQQYALLADHVYSRPGEPLSEGSIVRRGEGASAVEMRVLRVVDDPRTGYQGAVYQDQRTGGLIVAHRGTEFGREPLQDGVLADGGMVAARVNLQMPGAMALTQWAVEHARRNPQNGETPEVSVTGHSLGGTLAQGTAFRYQLHGETFNAYGAIGINGIPANARADVVNHVRASDPVSAANQHVGREVRYATPGDVGATATFAGFLVQGGAAHPMTSFLGPESALTAAARQRAEGADAMLDFRRGQVALARGGITLAAEGHLLRRELEGRAVGAALDGAGAVGNAAIDGAGRVAAGWTATVTQGGAITVRGGAEVGALAQQGGARVAGAASRVDNELRAGRDEALAGVMRLAEWAAPRWVGVGGSEFFERRAERERAAGRDQQAGIVAGGDAAAERTRDAGRSAATVIREGGAAAAERTREATDRAGDAVRGTLQDAAGAVRDVTARPTGPMYREPEVAPPLSDRRHPQFALYDGAQRGIDALPTVRPENAGARDRLTAALAAQGYMEGLQRIDHVVASPDGQRLFAVQGRLGDPAALTASIHVSADRQPVMQSTQLVDDLRDVRERQAQQAAPSPAIAPPAIGR